MVLDTPYGAAGRLRRFNSCIPLLFPPPSISIPATIALCPSGFPKGFSYWISQVFLLGIRCSRACELL